MAVSNYSLLMLEPSKINKEEDSEYDIKYYKSKSKYNKNNFEIFRPKTKLNNEENERDLKCAENQMKSLLSNYLLNIKSEKNVSDIYKQFNSIKNINDSNNNIKRNNSKRKSIKTNAHKKYDIKKEYISKSPKFSKKVKFLDLKYKKNNNFENNKSCAPSPKDNNLINRNYLSTMPSLFLEKVKNNKNHKSGKNLKVFNNKNNNTNVLNIKTLIKRAQTQNEENNINNDEINNKKNIVKKSINKNYLSLNYKAKDNKEVNKNKPIKSNSIRSFSKGTNSQLESFHEESKIKNKGTNKKHMKRSETIKNRLNQSVQNENKNKFLNLISNFKSLKQKLKQNIILRPEFQEKKEEKKEINIEKDKENNIQKKLTKKSDESQEEQSFHVIKRKKVMHFENERTILRKGPLYDSLDDEELEDEEEINSFYIDPNSNFCFYFDLMLFLINIITFVDIPLYLAMNRNFCKNKTFSLTDILNILNEVINISDVIFGFFRAFHNWEEQLIKKNDIIIKRYLLGWCLFDIMSAIPVYSIIKKYEPNCDIKYNHLNYDTILNNIQYLFLCFRLIKMLKIFSRKNRAWKYISNKLSDFWNLIFNICLIILAINYTACLYIFIARNSYPNWIMQTNLEITGFKNIYICSIYLLLMALTTVGYGDITCYSFKERIFQVFLLFIGIIAYSWLISSFSNYIQKLNDKSADYEKKKSILDEIKINNPNLPDILYDKILRYLKFKHFHEKNLKNIIFDCLPVGLKNNLIYEMYKPIIKNFIFFKNFQNTDFIVQVISCFKPILAYKNYVLVNEGDLIEDIIFVKRGILSVELPINMTNPEENIDKYLNNINTVQKNKNLNRINNSTFNFGISNTINSTFNYYRSSLIGNTVLARMKTLKDKKVYVRILGIRENEHFGDVLMFLEERSPLRVRVRTKKCELFFLKKIDALKISTSYQYIWRRINKKSVYNFKQIKRSIQKIIEVYCSVKIDKESNNEDFSLTKNGFWKHNNYNNSACNSTNRCRNEKLNKSEDELKIKIKNIFFNNNNIDENYFNKDEIKNKKNQSVKVFKTKFESLFFPELIFNSFSFANSSSSSEKTSQINSKKKAKNNNYKKTEKLLNIFNNNYSKETDNSYSFNQKMNKTNNNDFTFNNSINSKNINTENDTNNKSILKNNNINNVESLKNREKKIFNSSEDNFSDKEHKINNEIYPGEIIKTNNDENLLNKKLNFYDNNTDYNNEDNININSIIDNKIKNDKLKKLLNYFDEENKIIKNKNKSNQEISNIKTNKNTNKNKNQSNNFLSTPGNISSSELSNNHSSTNINPKSNIFSINSNISLTINSSYENYNLISGEKLIKSKILQKKVKEYIINESFNISSNITGNNIIKRNNSLEQNNIIKNKKKSVTKELTRKKRMASSIVYNTTNINYINNISTIKDKSQKKIRKTISGIVKKNNAINIYSDFDNNNNKRYSSQNRIDFRYLKNKHLHSLTKDNFKFNSKFTRTSKYETFINSNSSNNIKQSNINDDLINNKMFDYRTTKEIPRRFKINKGNTTLINTNLTRKRKTKDNLLMQINNNIKRTKQKLNDPDAFYNNYFNDILKEEMKEKNKSKI